MLAAVIIYIYKYLERTRSRIGDKKLCSSNWNIIKMASGDHDKEKNDSKSTMFKDHWIQEQHLSAIIEALLNDRTLTSSGNEDNKECLTA